MAIALVTSGTGSGSADNGGNVTLTLPTLLQNDVVYVAAVNGATAPAMSTAGYTQVASQDAGGSNARLRVFRKVMGASPDTQAVVTGDGTTGHAMTCAFICLRGVDTTTPEDATATSTFSGSGQPDSPSITTVSSNAWVIAVAGSNGDDSSITKPTNYSNHVTTHLAGASKPTTIALCTNTVAVAGAENPPAWSAWTAASWSSASIAVRPDKFVEGVLAGSGAASPSITASGIHRVAMSSSGVGAAAPTSARVKPTAVASSGVAALSLSAKKLQAGGISMAGVGSQSLAAAAIWRVSIAMAGTGAASSVGARVKLASIAPAGVGATSLTANYYVGTVLNGPGATMMALVGINESFQADLVVAGLSPLSLRGAAIRKTELASAGAGSATFVMNKVWNARMVIAGVGAAGPAGGAFATSAIGTGVVSSNGVATSNLNGSAYRQITMSASGLAVGTLRMGKVKTMTTALAGAGTPSLGGVALRQGAMAAPGAGVMALRGAYIQRSQFGFAGFTTSALDGVVFWGNFRRAHDTAMRPAENRLSTRPNEPRETTR